MSFLMAIQSSDAYGEVMMPALTDGTYDCMLYRDDYSLREDLRLVFEVTEDQWCLRGTPSYSVWSKGTQYLEKTLEDGLVFQVETSHHECLTIFVWTRDDTVHAYRKFRVQSQEISFGRGEDCDIILPELHALSHLHGKLLFGRDGTYLRDNSVNGVYVNGRRVRKEIKLSFGDVVGMCGISICYLGVYIAVGSMFGSIKVRTQNLKELRYVRREKRAYRRSDRGTETVIHISPRTVPKLYNGTITIQGAPQKREGDHRPAWMSVLPSLTMVIPMALGTLLMRTAGMVGIVIAAGSAVVGFTWAVINLRYQRKEEMRQEHLRLRKYENYLVRTADEIRREYRYNRDTMLALYPDARTCVGYRENTPQLWARKTTHPDFLFARLGLGEMPFQVKIEAPEKTFTLHEDELADRAKMIARHYETLTGVPLGVQLNEHNVIGILTGRRGVIRQNALELVRVLLVQIAANHSYTDVKIGILYDRRRNHGNCWDFARWLPHVWNKERNFRYIASDEKESNDVLYEIMRIIRARAEHERENHSGSHTRFYPHYVLFVDDPKVLETHIASQYLYGNGAGLGITTIMLSDVYENLPNDCDFVIEHSPAFSGTYQTRQSGETRTAVQFDALSLRRADRMARSQAGLRVNQIEISSSIPDKITFFEMLHVQSLEELDVLRNWRSNRTNESMRAVIGQKSGSIDCFLDINEKFHGPHGLVAGTTGSGKSEMLQTYILSLAIQFSPLDVGFFVIDFKGGGMANLFSNLPHMLGQITNLSGNQVRRAMMSIESENERRQRLFNEYGVNHIDAYTKLHKAREAPVPIPHLLIIIDEFAELKREEPEFMMQLISVAQVGRSLGVHLILATQKPSGTVDDNIWSNTRFRLCLRVADRQDSNDMLHKPDAAYLTQAGRCYLQVGNDEIYEQLQSGWSGAPYEPDGVQLQPRGILLDLQGRESLYSKRAMNRQRERRAERWMSQIVLSVQQCAKEMEISVRPDMLSKERRSELAERTAERLHQMEPHYKVNPSSLHQMEEILSMWPREDGTPEEIGKTLMKAFQGQKKLLEPREKTQLEATVDHLAELARKYGFENRQKLWMPLLPMQISLDQLEGYPQSAFGDGSWRTHENGFQLSVYIGLVDDPENQIQFPLSIDLVQNGHLAVVGSVTSGKSTFAQTLIYSMISTYSPREAVFYLIDFSSRMLTPFEEDVHVGGVILEGQDDRLNKFFGMMTDLLQERKQRIVGGSFSQYIRLNGNVMPAVVIVIDGYANFRSRTEDRYEEKILELAGTAESYGIYLVITCGGIGGNELQGKIFDNIRQCVALELTDRFQYSAVLKQTGIGILPEVNIKGRGLVAVKKRILEFQTALCCLAEHDYARANQIRMRCREMSTCWSGTGAAPIPEIPQKPVWSAFTKLRQYESLIRQKRYLPVAYVERSALIYSVDLSQCFCYLVLGREKSGKSSFMRNLLCAAGDCGGKLVLFDTPDAPERDNAAALDAVYVVDDQGRIDAYKEMILETNLRGRRRRELEKQGLEEDEIWEKMQEYQPVFYFISDLNAFCRDIYHDIEYVGKLSAGFENVLNKGRNLNVYFFAAAGTEDAYDLSAYGLYYAFVREKNGVVLGGGLNGQQVFGYQNLPYQEQIKQYKPGYGFAADPVDSQQMELIVIPQNRRVVPK